jgi:probable rRNA maturation factor
MNIELDFQLGANFPHLPSEKLFYEWVEKTLELAQFKVDEPPQLTIRIVDEAEGLELNQTWRHKNCATNVLSFPFEAPPEVDIPLLGDIVICAPVVFKEALEQYKSIPDHFAHLTIHGVLHLLGFDHVEEDQAEEMEALEVEILNALDIANPYL